MWASKGHLHLKCSESVIIGVIIVIISVIVGIGVIIVGVIIVRQRDKSGHGKKPSKGVALT